METRNAVDSALFFDGIDWFRGRDVCSFHIEYLPDPSEKDTFLDEIDYVEVYFYDPIQEVITLSSEEATRFVQIMRGFSIDLTDSPTPSNKDGVDEESS